MEIREFADEVLQSPELEQKLRPVSLPVSDKDPGEAIRVAAPARPANLQFAPRRTAPAMPRRDALRDPHKRAVAHHIMANHELQALEVMAWTLRAFPDAPGEFRIGMLEVMADEQRHTRMHVERLRMLNLEFGDLPVNGYIWSKAMSFRSVLDYLAGLPLVFEGRNLDHTLEFADEFAAVGDERSAALMRTVHRDEIRHVQFGIDWLRKLKPAGMSDWEVFEQHLHWPLRAEKACGDVFQSAARREAGLDDDFIDRLRQAHGSDDSSQV